ncbi:DUF397 domain-containing protein [Streptomyces sp. JJ36]|uniref:DUF397 domain-containing protein n=1 Tax=Streptomyces sp. JJ36 TaxID=2736645 RepID=UPI001F174A35|nr:DUF397 domain-containing protein [Streptomyces sp. JJ36]MCF6521627.1 DUF397 domain-containing protein [Streptomyces sp. JJ36]
MDVDAWQKSSYSNEGANCVNVAAAPGGGIRVRESDAPEAVLEVGRTALRGLLAAVKRGDVPGAGRG